MYKVGIALMLFSIGLYPMATESGEIASAVILVAGLFLCIFGLLKEYFGEYW